MNKTVIYYWYHHNALTNTQLKDIKKAIKQHDFEKFIEYYKELNSAGIKQGQRICNDEFDAFFPMLYLPDHATVFDENDEVIEHIFILDKENFNKITGTEYECG